MGYTIEWHAIDAVILTLHDELDWRVFDQAVDETFAEIATVDHPVDCLLVWTGRAPCLNAFDHFRRLLRLRPANLRQMPVTCEDRLLRAMIESFIDTFRYLDTETLWLHEGDLAQKAG